MLLRGGTMTGAQAHASRLVDHVVPTLAELDGATQELTDRLSSGGPEALRATKRLLNRLDDSMNADLSREAAELSARVLATPEARERLARR
jgi:enoyl-CoA hydratase/carnithine racemase